MRKVRFSPVWCLTAALLYAAVPGCRLPGRCEADSAAPPSPLKSRGSASVAGFARIRDSEDAPYSNKGQSSANPATGKSAPQPRRLLQFEDDLERFLPLLREDARGLANWNNAALLGLAVGGAVAMRQDLDDEVRRRTARHPERWGEGTLILGRIGEYEAVGLVALHACALRREDERLHNLSGSMISAYTLTGLTTLVIKGVANTDRPSREWNGGQFGFPSFHAAGTFSTAAVLDEYYGPKAGLPAYALAGLISWSRIDERDHDLSDVFFGAALGYIIGKSVAGRHLRGDGRVRLLPYVHPTDGSGGVMLDVAF